MPTRRPPGPLVLLADDNDDNRDLYRQYLIHHGMRVAEATDGHEALDAAGRLVPDVIVMDISMPGMDGLEATRRLKADTTTAAIPIAVITGHALDSTRRDAEAAGCDAYLTKPVLPATLIACIKKLLDQR